MNHQHSHSHAHNQQRLSAHMAFVATVVVVIDLHQSVLLHLNTASASPLFPLVFIVCHARTRIWDTTNRAQIAKRERC